MQEIWKLSLDWDDDLPECLSLAWNRWCNEVPGLGELRIPRYLFSNMLNVGITKIELHCFSDASQKAYATVACLRILFNDERIRTVFVASKTRVAPLKLILPRLELMGALLSARLSYRIIKALNLNLLCRFWTDSQITLFWIKGTANKFKPFIKNRIEEIVKLTSPEDWYFCPGKLNPSDLASRGTSVLELRDNPVWFQGPEWLELTSEHWSMQNNANLKGMQKSYIVLFTCATTRALHLELAPTMTTESFLMEFRRFISRRGNCRIMYSHNAKTFKCVIWNSRKFLRYYCTIIFMILFVIKRLHGNS
ncbi:hypothetical protein AVEN_270209-1 [Araneus ventricosus]|uniref:Integrase catalytic domain-containing protein n=1 Tax=Araneus ventricosus TaxID=182803 RepID=A0A4Y2FYV9_ARAVE|nr:hypothetical protein AVEN_270209-1 [Araneus ventricosus]